MPKRVLQGVVVSDKQDKTVVVKVERRFTHPVMKKTVRKTKNYHAHDENNTAKVGDTVFIEGLKAFVLGLSIGGGSCIRPPFSTYEGQGTSDPRQA
jgi:small subunit ribosomal protein S17